jgi:hypothetical protein
MPVSPVDSPDEDDCMRASSDIDTAGRERPPQTMARGPHGPRNTGVVHARSRTTDWARMPLDGTRRRPISTTSTRTTYCRSVSLAHYAGENSAHTGVANARGGSSAGDKFTSGTCPPLGGIPIATRERDCGSIARSGTASTAEHVTGVAGAIERKKGGA